jgi:hypothetical protein
MTFSLICCFHLDICGSPGHLSFSFIVKTYFGIFISCFGVMCIFNKIVPFIFSVEFNFFVLQTRPLLTVGNENSVLQPRYSARESVTEEVSLHEVPPLFENRPNLLAIQPHFGNIIALSEVTKPEDRYS